MVKFRRATHLVVLTGRNPQHSMAVLTELISELGLKLSTEKSRITTAQKGFDILGFHFVRK